MADKAPRGAAKDALFDGLASVARALSSGRRAEIVEVLAQSERTVEEIAHEIRQSVANTSHHLRTLARAGLVSTRKSGTHVYYRLASDEVLELWWGMRAVAKTRLRDLDELARAYVGDRDQVESISRDELLERLDRGDVVLVDVRPEPEYAAGHLPGAVSIPPERLGERLGELPDGHDVVAYCRGPYCAFADDAVRALQAQGRRARRLEDGLPEWRRAGGPVEVGAPSG